MKGVVNWYTFVFDKYINVVFFFVLVDGIALSLHFVGLWGSYQGIQHESSWCSGIRLGLRYESRLFETGFQTNAMSIGA